MPAGEDRNVEVPFTQLGAGVPGPHVVHLRLERTGRKKDVATTALLVKG